MKKTVLILIVMAIHFNQSIAQVKIGDNPNTISSTSLLELESTNKGFLVPRMTLANRLAIASPATALLVYQTDGVAGYYYYTGSAWTTIASGAGTQWSTNGSTIYYNTGNIGIGTITPSCLLNVKSVSPTTGGVCVAKFEGTQQAGPNNNVNLQLINNSTTSSKTFIMLGGAYGNLWATGSDLYGTNAQNYYIYDLNTFSTRFLINSTGQTGIGIESPNSLLHVGGSLSLPVTTSTSNYTATNLDHTILCDAGNLTVSLPSATTVKGRIYIIKKKSATAGTITIDPSGSETIDGSTTNTSITAQYQSLTIQSDGTEWVILSKN